MKRSTRIRYAVPVLLAATLFAFTVPVRSQTTPEPVNASASNQPVSPKAAEGGDEEAKQIETFRHSAGVQAIARVFHVNVETAAVIFEDLNSAVLIGVILIFLIKVLPKAFRKRTGGIQKQLVEARTATEEANERLSSVEQRLARLDDEIAAIRRQTEQDSLQDEVRIKQSLEEERQRIIHSAEHEIDAAGAAAQRQLKQFAAELAIQRAMDGIHMTPETDRLLIEAFGQSLAAEATKGGRN